MRYFAALAAFLAWASVAQAQTIPNASDLVAPTTTPTPMATSSALPAVPLLLRAEDVTTNGNWSSTTLNVAVGDVVRFVLEPVNLAPPSVTLTINKNPLTFPTGKPLMFNANVSGTWVMQVTTPGYASNTLTMTAR